MSGPKCNTMQHINVADQMFPGLVRQGQPELQQVQVLEGMEKTKMRAQAIMQWLSS